MKPARTHPPSVVFTCGSSLPAAFCEAEDRNNFGCTRSTGLTPGGEGGPRQEAISTLKKIRMDRIGLLVSTMAKETELSRDEIDELISILKEAKRDD